jgi:hypothetical protein
MMLFNKTSLSPYNCALLCQQAYERLPIAQLNSWHLVGASSMNNYGYHGVAYIHEADQLVLIAHRGTDTTILSNLISDSSLALNRIPPAQQAAEKFSCRIRTALPEGYGVVESGHSLGAYHAEINAGNLGGYCITFESPGTANQLPPDIEPRNFISFLSTPNFIDVAKPHVGTLYRIYVPHIDPAGHRVDGMSTQLKGLIENVLDPITGRTLQSGAAVLDGFLGLSADIQCHQLMGLIKAMSPQIGYPWLMRRMQSWPRLSDFIRARITPDISASSAYSQETIRPHLQVVQQNRRLEATLQHMPHYQAAEWVVPASLKALQHGSAHERYLHSQYCLNAIAQFETFDNNIEQRQALVEVLGVTPSLLPEPSLAVASAQASSSTAEQEGSDARQAPQAVTTAQTEEILGNNVSEERWVISLLKGTGNANHAFLLLDGMKDGKRFIQQRLDFFLDLARSAEVRDQLPTGSTEDSAHASWVATQQLAGRGFVRLTELRPEDFEYLLLNCEHQSYSITPQQGRLLMRRFEQEQKRLYRYFYTGGDNPSSTSTAMSITTEAHNCISWCQKVLREELSITVGNRWSFIKNPRLIVEQAIAQESGNRAPGTQQAVDDQNTASPSRFSYFSPTQQKRTTENTSPQAESSAASQLSAAAGTLW